MTQRHPDGLLLDWSNSCTTWPRQGVVVGSCTAAAGAEVTSLMLIPSMAMSLEAALPVIPRKRSTTLPPMYGTNEALMVSQLLPWLPMMGAMASRVQRPPESTST